MTAGSMLERVAEMTEDWQRNTARSQQTRLGPSEIGHPCDRQIAYKLAYPRKRAGLQWAAALGVWGHEGMEGVLRHWNDRLGRTRYVIEGRVEADDDVRVSPTGERILGGRTDCYDLDTDEVIDWKFGSERSIARYRSKEHPGPTYQVQAHTYGQGWQRAGYPVKGVRIVFLPRGSNNIFDGWEWGEPYRPEIVEAAIARLHKLGELSQRAVNGEVSWSQFAVTIEPYTCANFCPYFRAEQPPSAEGCPGHTRPRRMLAHMAQEAKTLAAVRALWWEIRNLGELTPEAEGLLTARANAIKAGGVTEESEAIDTLKGAGFHGAGS